MINSFRYVKGSFYGAALDLVLPLKHISMLPVTLWGDLTAVSTAALSSDSSIKRLFLRCMELSGRYTVPSCKRSYPARQTSSSASIGFTSRITKSEPFFTEVPCIPTFIACKDGVFLADRRVFIAHRSSDHCVQRPRLTSSSPVIGI